jgi:probable phosphoglycerate mutase
VDTRLLVVRHGETDWNRERRWQGHADPELNDAGRRQARALGELVAGLRVEAAYTSDLRRASETAELAVAGLGLEVVAEPRLREIDVGEWSGLTTAEVEQRFPAGAERRRAGGLGWDHGETYESLNARFEQALLAIAGAHPGRRVLVVTHGGPMRFVRQATGCPLPEWHHVGNCELDEIGVREGRMRWLDSSRGGLHQQVQG